MKDGASVPIERATGDHEHVPGLACPTCDTGGAPPPATGRRRSVLQLQARGEDFKIMQLAGQLFVCSKANGSCCCGWDEKGRMPFDNSLWSEEWERRRIRDRVHLSFVGCLGPCAVGNNALLILYGRTIWLKDLNDPALSRAVYDWIESMLDAGEIVPAPSSLADHIWDRYLPSPDGAVLPAFAKGAIEAGDDAIEGLDPVCLMAVDAETARHHAEHEGRVYAFCAPACKKLFLADPESYLSGAASRSMSA